MNELRRLAYLEAMGIPGYVSRTQLPGAAVTRRLTVVRSTTPARPLDFELPKVETARPGPAAREAAPAATPVAGPPRFSLAAMVCGGCLWLEELEGVPLAREQVQLVQAMAHALGRATGGESASPSGTVRPQVELFDWPIHNNRQLDQGEDAARAGVAGFVGRRLEQHGCRGLVLLGQRCATRLPLEQLGDVLIGTAPGTAAMLADPALKRRAWIDLLSLAARL